MQWEIILIALLPVPVFYLVYFRHFLVYFRDIDYSPQYAEQIESFLYGVAYALLIIIAQPYIVALVPGEGVIAASLVKAALVEKLGALAVIYLIQRNYRSFNLVEAIVSGVIFGAGFSFVENIAYLTAYGRSVILVRAIFSVPLHLVTCGLLAYYLALRNYSESSFYRRYNALRAVIIPIALHAVYDSLLLRGGSLLYFIGPMLIIMVMALEIVFAHAKTIPFLNELRAEHIRFEPNFELGFGDNVTLAAINFDALYRFASNWDVWSPYLGGGLGVNIYSFDIEGVGNHSETELGVNLIGGIERGLASGDRFFIVGKIGLADAPDFKVTVGWTFLN